MHRPFAYLLLAATTATLGAPAAAAQAAVGDSLKHSAIRRLLTLQQTDSLMLAGMDQGLSEQPADPNLPAGFMDSLRLRARREIGQFVERLVPLYDSLYTANEINDLVAFYRTKLGQRVIETQLRLTQAITALARQWGMELAGKVLVDLSRHPLKRPM